MATPRSGLVALVHSVRDYFTANGVTASVSLGWKERSRQDNQGAGGANRVVFTPSDDSGRGGTIDGIRGPGSRNNLASNGGDDTSRRGLYSWERFVVVSIWAQDDSQADPEDEEAQIEATEALFEWTMRAVQAFAHQDARWGDVTWTPTPVDRSFGRELRAALTYRHPMFDLEVGMVGGSRISPSVTRNPPT